MLPDAPQSHAEPSGESAPPRTWIIALPPGTALLNANQRLHWAERGKRVRVDPHRRLGRWPGSSRSRSIDRRRPRHVPAEPSTRRRDAGNWSRRQGGLDGLTDAGVWLDDDSEHVLSETYVIGEMIPGGQLVLTITEVNG